MVIVQDFEDLAACEAMTLSKAMDYLIALFDCYFDFNTEHLRDKDIKQAISYMQNFSVVTFFVLVHIPLSQVNAAFSFITAFTIWMVDSKTKASIYYAVTFMTRVIVSPKAAYKQWRKNQKVDPLGELGRSQIDREIISKKDKVRLKNIVDWVCLNVAIFGSIMLNYLYTTFLHDAAVAAIKNFIYFCDRAGFEAHFIRFLQMTLFEEDGMAERDHIHTFYEILHIVSFDAILLATIILPLYLAAMHFYTAPYKKIYRNKL